MSLIVCGFLSEVVHWELPTQDTFPNVSSPRIWFGFNYLLNLSFYEPSLFSGIYRGFSLSRIAFLCGFLGGIYYWKLSTQVTFPNAPSLRIWFGFSCPLNLSFYKLSLFSGIYRGFSLSWIAFLCGFLREIIHWEFPTQVTFPNAPSPRIWFVVSCFLSFYLSFIFFKVSEM